MVLWRSPVQSIIIVNNSSPGREALESSIIPHREEEALACAGPSWWCFGAFLKYFVIPKILLLLVECLPVATV
jgi:hypothetical protein